MRSPKGVRRREDQTTQTFKGLIAEEQPVDWKMIRKIGKMEKDITEAKNKESFKKIVQSV